MSIVAGRGSRVRPNFLFIGPDKTGSTWLYNLFRAHPGAYVPAAKDIYFFDRYYQRGWMWYERFFRQAPGDAAAVGEISHDYILSAVAAERIRRDLPNVRLLTILRDPVERSFSQYLYMKRSGLVLGEFEQAMTTRPEILRNSQYHTLLAPYLRGMRREQVLVLWFEDLVRNPVAFGGHVLEFLGLPVLEDLPYREKARPAAMARSRLLARGMKAAAELARRYGCPSLVGRVKHSRLAELLYRPYADDERPHPASQTVARLRCFFRREVDGLEEEFGRDLEHWK